MAKKNLLTFAQVKNADPRAKVYRLNDGAGLSLKVTPNGGRYWQLRHKNAEGKEQTASFGTFPEVKLKEARDRRDAAREDLRDGVTPKARKRQDEKERLKELRLHGHLFEDVSRDWFDRVKGNWINKKHRAQVIGTLEKWAFPKLGRMPVNDISTADIREVIEAITCKGHWETGQRVYQRITAVLDDAIEKTHIKYNVAMPLRGKLFILKPEEVKNRHFPSLKPVELPELVKALRKAKLHPVTKLAVELQMLTFSRPFELRSAEWKEIDFDNAVWEVPAHKMKMKRPHRVPISPQAINALRRLQPHTGRGRFLFPHRSDGKKCMSEATVNTCIKRLNKGQFEGRHCAHGFRSTASTYLNSYKTKDDVRKYAGDPVERQLSHIDPDPIRRSYDGADHWDLRVEMMDTWADFVDECGEPKVTSIETRRKAS